MKNNLFSILNIVPIFYLSLSGDVLILQESKRDLLKIDISQLKQGVYYLKTNKGIDFFINDDFI